jgi:quercetin dioxygenase-like cupin family protein
MTNRDKEDVLTQDELTLIAEGAAPISVDSSAKQRMRLAIKKRISDECPTGGKTIRANINEWFDLNEEIAIKVLHQDFENRIQTSLWRLKPGAVITAHRHENDEECLVIEGSIKVGNHELFAGDYHIMEKGSYHTNLISETGALLYLKHDMHERHMGPNLS